MLLWQFYSKREVTSIHASILKSDLKLDSLLSTVILIPLICFIGFEAITIMKKVQNHADEELFRIIYVHVYNSSEMGTQYKIRRCFQAFYFTNIW